MTFAQLHSRIKEALPEGEDRRDILTGVSDLEEGLNQCLSFFLAASGHVFQKDGSWIKPEDIKRQVNPR